MSKHVFGWCIYFCSIIPLAAQNNKALDHYRATVLEYNHDLHTAKHTLAMHEVKQESAKADFRPKLSADIQSKYTGNPLEINRRITGYAYPLHLKGQNFNYGAALTVTQPLYSGGAIKANYNKAEKETEIASYDLQRITNDVIYNSDIYYWNHVACMELTKVTKDYRQAVSELVECIRQRVESGYIDRNDLLMAQVKLNEADFQVLQSINNTETARLAMNSYAGISDSVTLKTDSVITPPATIPSFEMNLDTTIAKRPEISIGQNKVEVKKAEATIENAQYKPNISMAINGNYTSPGYDFKAGPDPNYAVYAQVSIPIFEWGKRKNTKRIGTFNINIAEEQLNKTKDNIRLEIETASCNYSKAVEKIRLTASSLDKASENEHITTEKYKEGTISIVEVINAQLYHLQAKINYIQSKLDAQLALSAFNHATYRISMNQ